MPNTAGLPPILVEDPSKYGKTYLFHHPCEVWGFIKGIYWTDCVIVKDLHYIAFDLIYSWAQSCRLVRLSHYDPDKGVLVVILLRNAPSLEEYCAHWVDYFSFVGTAPESRFSSGDRYLSLNLEGEPRAYGESSYSMHPGDPYQRREVQGWPWPSVTIEAGVDYPLDLMREKAKWWITASDGAVKVVLLVKVDKQAGAVHIELWKGFPAPSPLNTEPRITPRGREVKVCITLDQHGETYVDSDNNETYTESDLGQLAGCCEVVSEAKDLTLWFDDVFLRPAGNGQAKGVVIRAGSLKDCAAHSWLKSNGKIWEGKVGKIAEDQDSDGLVRSPDTPVTDVLSLKRI
jgi:hypothetical protein